MKNPQVCIWLSSKTKLLTTVNGMIFQQSFTITRIGDFYNSEFLVLFSNFSLSKSPFSAQVRGILSERQFM